jgi:hypothetical protein
MPNQISDPLLLRAALIGLQQMKADIDGKMSDLRQRLGIGTDIAGPTPRKVARKVRRLSAAGRAHIIAALKKRWAARREEQAQAQAPAKPATRRRAKPAPKAKAPTQAAPKKASVKAKAAPARKAAAVKTNLRRRTKVARGKTAKPQPAAVAASEQPAPAAEA